jgi:hypothetical protein
MDRRHLSARRAVDGFFDGASGPRAQRRETQEVVMSSIRPTTSNDLTETKTRVPQVRNLTFVLGPPRDQESVVEISQAAERVGVSSEELWIEIVRGNVAELLEANANGRSILDDMVSEALGEQVTVWGVKGALHVQAGRQFPGLVIQTDKVVDGDGQPVTHDFSDRHIRGFIAHALMQYTHADWATCTAAYQPDGLGFPSLDGAVKEA